MRYPLNSDADGVVPSPRFPALEESVDFYMTEGITSLVGPGEGQVAYVPLVADDMTAQQEVWAARETGTREG